VQWFCARPGESQFDEKIDRITAGNCCVWDVLSGEGVVCYVYVLFVVWLLCFSCTGNCVDSLRIAMANGLIFLRLSH
jgi:hypothetical protein